MPVIHSPILTVSKRGNLKMWKLPTLPMVSCIARAAPVQVCDNRLNKTIWNAYNFWSYYWHRHAIISSRPSIISPGSLISEFLSGRQLFRSWRLLNSKYDTHKKSRVSRAILHRTHLLITDTHTHTHTHTVIHRHAHVVTRAHAPFGTHTMTLSLRHCWHTHNFCGFTTWK